MDGRCSLSLFERLSQVYLHKYTILLLIIMLKLYLMKKSVLNDLDSLQDQSEAFCTSLNNFSSEITALPTQMSNLLNSVVVSYLNYIQNSWVSIIHVFITVIKNLLIFYVQVFLGTFTCLLNAAVSGTMNLALDATEDVIKGVNSTVVTLTDGIEDALSGISKVLNEVVDAYEDVKSFISGDDDYSIDSYKSKIDLKIDSLRNLSIPSSVLTDIENFKKDVPDFDELQKSTKKLIASPFDLVSKELVKSSTFNKNISVDDLPTLKSFDNVKICDNSDDINDQIQKLAKIVSKTSMILILVMIFIIVANLMLTCLVEYLEWRKQRKLVETLRENDNTEDVLHLYNNLFVGLANKCIPSAVKNPVRGNVLWTLSYVNSKYGNTILFFSILGLLSVLLQYILIRNLQFEANLVSNDFGQRFKKESISYIKSMNGYLIDEEDQMNEELFGYITNSSETLNSTINDMLTSINDTVSSVFEDTPFESPISNVVYCVIGSKLQAIEKGLTWINEHLKITVLTFSENLISKNLSLDDFPMNGVNKFINKSFKKIVKAYEDSLKFELKIALLFLFVWLLQLVIAAIILLIRYFMDAKKIEGSDIFISNPKQLTEDEKHLYGYPLTDPMRSNKMDTSSSFYDSSSMDTLSSKT